MLIEIFTNGKVMIDGQDAGKQFKAEDVMYDYLVNPEGFVTAKTNGRKNKTA